MVLANPTYYTFTHLHAMLFVQMTMPWSAHSLTSLAACNRTGGDSRNCDAACGDVLCMYMRECM